MCARIALYGKGGIGKSTVAANLAYSLAEDGLRVRLVGCDPKHDTCRQVAGRDVPTVLEGIRGRPPSDRSPDDFMVRGCLGIECIEAGGPEAGVGCAGKGILTTFGVLDGLGSDADVTIYDVLGDVVCGGFAVPMRREHSDAVMIVTSGEYMSLYAANNIMRATLGPGGNGGRVAGIVLNRRDVPGEAETVASFSEATGVPVVADIRRSGIFAEAERRGITLCQMSPGSEEAEAFRSLARSVRSMGDAPGHPVRPLTDPQMDSLRSEGYAPGPGGWEGAAPVGGPPVVRLPAETGKVGNGPVGAMLTARRVTDVPVVLHGPRSCGYTMLREILDEIPHWARGQGGPVRMGEIVCTDAGTSDTIFGGVDRLGAALDALGSRGETLVMVVVTCQPGMTGDDCRRAVREAESRHPGMRVILADSGSADASHDAHMDLLRGLAGMIDTSIPSDPSVLTVVDDSPGHFERGRNRESLDSTLGPLGIVRAPGFIGECRLSDIVGLRRAGTAVLGTSDPRTEELRGILSDKGLHFMGRPLPRGFHDTPEWLEELGSLTGREREAEASIKNIKDRYSRESDSYRKSLEGVAVSLVTADPAGDGWIARTLCDAGADVRVHPAGRASPDALIDGVSEHGADVVIGDRDLTHGMCGVRIGTPETYVGDAASLMLLARVRNAHLSDRSHRWLTWGECR